MYNYSSGPINKHFWDFGDGNQSSAAAPVHNYTTTGFISLRYIGTDTTTGCNDTAVINFTIDGSGNIKRKAFVFTVVDKTNTASVKTHSMGIGFKVFPNPFTNQITVSVGGAHSVNSIALFNAMGQYVNSNFEVDNDANYTIHTDGQMASGIYFIKILMDDTITYLKIIKE